MSRETDIAWAAGLFEGEGTWGCQRSSVSAALSMTDSDVVERFRAVVGVGKIVSRKLYRAHHKPQVMWRVTDRAGVETVLEMFKPWLSDRRLRRGEEILAIQAEIMASNARHRSEFCRNGHRRTPANTHRQTRNTGPAYLRCRDCSNEWQRRSRSLDQLAQTMADVLNEEES